MALSHGTVDPRAAYVRMVDAMRSRQRALVAFSGGVDSGLVAKVAEDALGAGALAVLADAESLSRWELEDARRVAAEIGISLRIIRISELASPAYRENPTNRCYFCRSGLATALTDLATREGYTVIADGINVSDLGDHRPGIQAMNEAGVWHPLVEYGHTKADVRAIAKAVGLSIWNKPSNACLSSRVPYGTPITVDVLRRVEAAEGHLRDLGFRQVRVRHLGHAARIEVLPDEVPRLVAMAEGVAAAFRTLGYAEIAIDPRGYQSGSLNEMLTSSRGSARTSPRP